MPPLLPSLPPLSLSSAASLPAFLLALAFAPKTVGAIAPSGKRLARLITREIDPRGGPVLELGPGTGVFTRALLDRGLPPSDLTLVEIERKFVRRLRNRFPGTSVMEHDACRLQDLPQRGYASVVSGLPLRNMPAEVIGAILAGAFTVLAPGGAFYQFTYGRACSVPDDVLDALGLKAELLGRVILNMPPASVFRLTRPSS